MNRPRKPIDAFGVFDPSGRLETTRLSRTQAEDAAKIIGGTNWERMGFTVEPVEVTRSTTTSATHPDMIG